MQFLHKPEADRLRCRHDRPTDAQPITVSFITGFLVKINAVRCGLYKVFNLVMSSLIIIFFGVAHLVQSFLDWVLFSLVAH